MNSTVVTGCSVCACRLILSLRSLAVQLKYDPDAIFTHLELARIYGKGLGTVKKTGQFGDGIIIERNSELELEVYKHTGGAALDQCGITKENMKCKQNLGPWRPQS
jgi:cyanate lyase